MWIYSKDRGLFNLDFVNRITADVNGTYLSIDGSVIFICPYNALRHIQSAINNNQSYVEV